MESFEEIYLTRGGDDQDELMWCQDRISKNDTRYVRYDIVRQKVKKEREKTEKWMKKYKELQKKLEEVYSQSAYASIES